MQIVCTICFIANFMFLEFNDDIMTCQAKGLIILWCRKV